jgi:cellulose 1,4-beta-cellobiosidase
MGDYLADIQKANAAGAKPPIVGTFVVYDLPDRDCAAAASNGEYSIANNGVALYKAYIQAILALVQQYSDVNIIFIIGKNLYPCNASFEITLMASQSPTLWPTWSPT